MWALSLDLVPFYSEKNSAGTGFHFPSYHRKKTHAQIILYPCGAPENTITATVNEIIAM